MSPRTAVLIIAGLTVTAAVAFVTRDTWRGWVLPDRSARETAAEEEAHDTSDHVRISAQARRNLGIIVKPLVLQTCWRTIPVPGTVIERPGTSDRGVSAPVAGVIKRVAAVPGDIVRPGDELFTLRLLSESLQTSQTELHKAARELQINQDQRARLEAAARTGSVPAERLQELDYQQRRLSATLQAYRQDLAARGLTPEQIDRVAAGQFVTEMTLRVPDYPATVGEEKDEYEVQELKVNPGEQVQAGQVLAYLARHQSLYIEGRAFRREVPLLARATQEGWPLTAVFAEEAEGDWPPLSSQLKILFIANTVDPASQTFPFYVPLANQHRSYTSEGKTYRLWRFRPGQRVRLGIPVERFDDVFVVPAAAVVREGGECYIFRQNGDYFERRPVRLLHEDEVQAVLANDGSVTAGSHVAHAGAAALNRALKAQAAGDTHDHGHHHHGHEH